MSDTTQSRPIIQDSSLHDDTVIYRACKPRVRAVEINVFEELGIILNFRPSGMRVAREIIRRQHGENIIISATNEDLAESLFPDLPEVTRLSRLVRAKKYLKEDQNYSRFQFIHKLPRDPGKTQNGQYYGVPSKYRPGHYWNVSDELQNRSNEKDREFLSFSAHKCRRLERELLTEILEEMGFIKIIRTREKSEKEKSEKEKSPSLPCQKPCAHCALNEAAKSATASEANGCEAERLREIPNEVLEVELDKFADFFERYLRECGAIDKKFTYAVKRAHHALEMAEASASDLIIREKTGHQIRLVGGQPR